MTAPSSAPARALDAPGYAAIILAAGKSTRMKSSTPKPLHQVCGLPMTSHVINACIDAGVSKPVVVIGHEAELVREGLGDSVEYAIQVQQRGSGDAVKAAMPLLADWKGSVLVIAGDIPLIRAETLQDLLSHHSSSGASLTLLTATIDDPTGYGRIVRNADGTVSGIVEHKDCTPEQLLIKEWNPSIYCFNADDLRRSLSDLGCDNAQNEYYLTDTVGIISAGGGRIEAITVADATEVTGVNNRVELAKSATSLRERILARHMLNGVTVVDPASTYIDASVVIGQDTTIEPNTHLRGVTVVGQCCTLGPNTIIKRSNLGDSVSIIASHVDRCELGDNVRIGPFANLRPGCVLSNDVKVGDFVELKAARLGEGVSAAHLSYIGDAEIGARTNIGAGVVTCNYDGQKKHKTHVGQDAFVGTNSTLIAPVEIGDGAYVAAGSSITDSVPGGALAIARSHQTNKPEWAKRRRERKEKSDGSGSK
jgi:bifunctional UDP-N-acetylglucosamine pyrophosphorylase/glucosamine-1-phosphate N-acetyltransferase